MANLSTYTKTGFQLVCLLLWQHHVGLMAASKGSLLRFFVLIRSSEISSNVFYTEINVVNPIIILPVGNDFCICLPTISAKFGWLTVGCTILYGFSCVNI